MIRRSFPIVILIAGLLTACAGPDKLAEKSGDKLAEGRLWQAWTLAVKALDKAPGNPNARAAADEAGAAISEDWQRRILALADVDSLGAAEEVLKFTAFRADAARYTAVPVPADWPGREQALRNGAARAHYESGIDDLRAHRPKSACRHFLETERFVDGYRDVADRARLAREQGMTRVAVVPLEAAKGNAQLGRDVAASWRGDLIQHFPPSPSTFTLVLPEETFQSAVRGIRSVRAGRESALRLGRGAGADRIVWGTLGEPKTKTGLEVFSDRVVRRVKDKDADGRPVTRWVSVPIQVVARTRTVELPVEYEILSARDGSSLARRRETRRLDARVVWTAFTPDGPGDEYALYTEDDRRSDPNRTKAIETRWRATVGESTTLAQVIDARRNAPRGGPDRGQALARFMAGAAFVFLEDLPSAEELAFGAAAGGWVPLHQDLVRLDGVDDVDLGVAVAGGRE